MAQNMSTSAHVSDRVTAMRLGKASLWVSVSGIVIGTILIIIFVILFVTYAKKACAFSLNGKCYVFKQEMSYYECTLKGGHFDSLTETCYFNYY